MMLPRLFETSIDRKDLRLRSLSTTWRPLNRPQCREGPLEGLLIPEFVLFRFFVAGLSAESSAATI